MIVTEEIDPAQKEKAGAAQEPQKTSTEISSEGGSAQGVQPLQEEAGVERSGRATDVVTTVTTADMSVEQAGSGKTEGWSATLEQPKITTVIDTQVCRDPVPELCLHVNVLRFLH